MKTLPEWLSEMERLDKGATPGPWGEYEEPSGALPGSRAIRMPKAEGDKCFSHHYPNNTTFIVRARTELPRAVEVIKAMREMLINYESNAYLGWGYCGDRGQSERYIDDKIEKILNKNGGEG